ncbi:N-acetylglucosamine-6-phosphate deacetylase [Symbiobacterium thermophilum]|uniref:N-acetylglucosamine-6-phosphate deacetylase n=1 Tax=Symbiobacterium thermophilum (strain DSM 24528 / JCM 14929 / IAM 14863 / T) TaxID=292459 RepID=Q67PX8_SYMTH|nr:N-acetylglucosamine-6-phosphate deacetylase [Symbiobacterium thermophilum]BAD40265.1 N-acetylglucosamine-6-phosphate deacetylase [Symbiobacterium thermophilum IAM 14863]
MGRPIALTGGRVLTPGRELVPATLLIEGTEVAGLAAPGEALPPYAQTIDVSGCLVAPGFIDTHVHGGMGCNFMLGTPEALAVISARLVQGGTTACLATTTSAPARDIAVALDTIARASRAPRPGQVEILGAHLEGPFINPEKAGSQARQHLRPPEPAAVQALWEAAGGALRVVTIAPELPGAGEAIRYLAGMGVQVSLGHSAATYEEAREALGWGVRRATHLYNAMPALQHRRPGAAAALLEDPRVFVELTVDGHHVHPAMVALTYRLVGPERLVLVTDGVDVAGLEDGTYTRWEGTPVRLQGGECRTESGSLAGSTLRLDQAVRNMVRFAGVPVAEALRMASETPAQALGIDRKGRLAPGKDADVVVLSEDLEAILTIARGHVVYDGRPGGRAETIG